ncbi:MAG: membrane protein insertase YidC [Prevotellaceae bacterium]|jgi:YidC/Oxa1 family membrane protein insertase|nr:membrane protein insertase YidC [Prevotellaceae bacterium]
MDKNTLLGILLIVAIIFGFSYLNRPSEEQIAAQRARDSIAAVAVAQARALAAVDTSAVAVATPDVSENDSVRLTAQYAQFAAVATGTSEKITLENNRLKLVFNTEGGGLYSAQLKDYTTYDSLPLLLFEGQDENLVDFTLHTANNRVLNTSKLFFAKQSIVSDSLGQRLTLRLAIDADSYLDFVYSLPRDGYMLQFSIVPHAMDRHLAFMANTLDMSWYGKIRQQEKGRKFESRYTTLNYRFVGDDMEKLSESSNDSKNAPTPLRWIAFKDQFFSTVLVADESFISARLSSTVMPDDSPYMKEYEVKSSVPFDPTGSKTTNLRFYLGPNHYKTLKECTRFLPATTPTEDLNLQELVPLGWTLFRWVSQWMIIPLFNFFGSFISNYGIIILLLTLVIKIVILPLTFKSYMSTAKMRVLKPQIDVIHARIPADKAMERQQATMALYKSVGVSPMGGCLPMILQMPFLFAMFSFFPTAIELRQQSFLWVKDLSTYDAILSWDTYIPLITPYFGNHISLFCLLMTVTNLIYTKLNMQSQGGMGGDQMKMMKWMMYLMPLMFLFIFNSYASGLSYYYFISLLLTIGQTYLFRLFVNEEKLLHKLEANKLKKKPAKKSGFMARLEEAQRQQAKALREQQKRRSPNR